MGHDLSCRDSRRTKCRNRQESGAHVYYQVCLSDLLLLSFPPLSYLWIDLFIQLLCSNVSCFFFVFCRLTLSALCACPIHFVSFSILAYIKSVGNSGMNIKQFLLAHGLELFQEIDPLDISRSYKVFVNGEWFGIHPHPDRLVMNDS